MRQPEQMTVLASAARTATVNSETFANYGHRGLVVVIDATAITSTPSVVVTIQGYSALGDDYYTILASAAVATAVVTVLRVFPGSAVTTNLAANDQLPPLWRINAVHGNANSITYSINALLLP